MRVFVALVIALIFCSRACAMTVSQYLDSTDEFKSGYVFAMMEALTQIAHNDKAADQRSLKLLQCMVENKINSQEGVRIVGQHILQNPKATATPMIGVVIQAFNNSCEAYLE